MRLYHHPHSTNARRAVMTAVHLGAPVELVFVDLAKGAQRAPEFLAKNPNGRVPVLEDGDFVLSESHAIMQYLAEKTPHQTIYPQEIRARADVNRWMFWNAYHFTPATGILNWEHMIKGFLNLGAPDPVEVKKGEQRVTECARVLDAHLRSKEWLVQDRLTLADFAVASALATKDAAKHPVGDFANLLRWFGRVQALEAWKKTNPS